MDLAGSCHVHVSDWILGHMDLAGSGAYGSSWIQGTWILQDLMHVDPAGSGAH